jgi:hypothetical protein
MLPGWLFPPDVLGLRTSLMLGPRAMPIPMNDARLSSTRRWESGNWEIRLGDAASVLPLLLHDPEEVEGLPSADAGAAGTDKMGGVHSPAPGSRDGASGEKLNVRFSGGGTLARLNLAGVSAVGCVWAGSEVGGGGAEAISIVGEANDQVVESGVGGAPRFWPGPKSNLKPVSRTGFGRAGSDVSSVGAGLGWYMSRRQLGCLICGVWVRDGGELCEL